MQPSRSSDKLSVRFPHRARTWQLRSRQLVLGPRPLLMGIVNVTPDSFSDGGRFFDTARAIEHGLRLAAEGADLLDVGGESTRPYSTSVELAEELRRVVPVVREICRQVFIPVSIDTSKADVALAACDAGADLINDVTGLSGDPRMRDVARQTSAGVCVMHMLGTPQTMQDNPQYTDVVTEIHEYLRQRRDELLAAGLDAARIGLDPGIGFGKTHEHNVILAANSHRFHDLGQPLLVGHSRKAFIGKWIGDKTADRTFGNLGVSLALARQGVQVLRVHDVRATREALILFEACGGIDGP